MSYGNKKTRARTGGSGDAQPTGHDTTAGDPQASAPPHDSSGILDGGGSAGWATREGSSMPPTRKARAHTGRSRATPSGGRGPRNPANTEPATTAGTPETSPPPHDSETHDTTTDSGTPERDSGAAGPRLSLIGPTSEATRRLVAESRARQGLTPYVNDPHVIESLALFLRNAIDTLDSEDRRDV